MDIFSRKIVGWQVYENGSSELASEVMRDICERENIAPSQVVLHSDNGSPMKGATMLATLQALGVMPSFSRPAVSNDNPYSESLFQDAEIPARLPAAPIRKPAGRKPVGRRVCALVQRGAPPQRHPFRHAGTAPCGPGRRAAGKRAEVYEAAKARHPERWSGATRNWQPVTIVHLNPEKACHGNRQQKGEKSRAQKSSINAHIRRQLA